MSFANFDVEAQRSVSKGRPAVEPEQTALQNDLDAIISKTSDQVQTFASLVQQHDKQRRQLGTKRDCLQLRNNVNVLEVRIEDMEGAIKQLVNNLVQLINKNQKSSKENSIEITSKQILIKERLTKEFSELQSSFHTARRQAEDKMRQAPIQAHVDEQTPLLDNPEQQQQQQAQVDPDLVEQTELQYHMLLTEERNRELNQVSQGIQEVNSIFKDLSELVQQQGEQLDTVEDNILQLHSNAQGADRELQKAHEYQRRRSKWSCIFLVALCVFVLIVVLAVLS
ncbi:Syntaxin VAM3 [Meyerozyma sp. JA9]|nr:Syntaxin VAM3 [Meyerozyma sp. JA9]